MSGENNVKIEDIMPKNSGSKDELWSPKPDIDIWKISDKDI